MKNIQSSPISDIIFYVGLYSLENAEMNRLHSRDKRPFGFDDLTVHPTELCAVKGNRHKLTAPNKTYARKDL
ncbi:hypothetical protein COS86_05910 [Candidatus Bathyarchaeota archaeon CG07_land_8_20_14_0_80_47_9]|nr:MAG: hypothetical protein COS86_05910 [Candidatus Bathyarchaeota archaeon CG07_land_8_20_14_0_80_47_9]